MPATTWGNPNAAKRVFLIHGLAGSSHSWHHVATELASRGYFVTAPDLLGHGIARRGSDYTIAALENELRPYFTAAGGNDPPYDIVIGGSLGGILAATLLPLLKSTRPIHVVLLDPPLEMTPESNAMTKTMTCASLTNPQTPESFQKMFPHLQREVAVLTCLGQQLCDISAVGAILDQNVPWSFSHLLETVPDNVNVTVLAADPSRGALVKEEDLKKYPRVTSKTVWGAPHVIIMVAPQAIIETALEGTERQD